MFSESAALYDLIYSSFKNYETEADQLAGLIKTLSDHANSVLDVACGTGEHARLLSQRFGYHVDGIDIEPEFIRIAKQKNPTGSFWQADMKEFEVERNYDVVLCMFSSIGYVKTLDNVKRTLRNFRQVLSDDGLIIVEPWFTPDAFNPGRFDVLTVETEDLKICRMSHASADGMISKITFEYLIGSSDGIRRAREVHELGLFTVSQMKKCFEDARLSARFEEPGPTGRGLYVARKY